MPSPYSSAGSVNDSVALARNLGVRFETVPISDVHDAYLDTLNRLFPDRRRRRHRGEHPGAHPGQHPDGALERDGRLVLSTGNKSELAVGYCTLYGDMSGGLAVISDVPKTMVYELARYMNREQELIPAATIEKPPSAELRPDQLDQDTLPAVRELDNILRSTSTRACRPTTSSQRGWTPRPSAG